MNLERPAAVNASEGDATDFQIEVLQGLSGFLSLRAEWETLFETAAKPQNVFQSHSFLRHWAAQYVGNQDRLYVVCGRIGDQLVMVWPLIIGRQLGVDVIGVMGAPVAQFFDILIDDVEHKTELLNAGWRALRKLKADAFIAQNIRQDASIRFCTAMQTTELPGRTAAPYAELCLRINGDELGCAYSPRERSNYRRRLRRAGDHGDVGFTSPEPGPLASELASKAISFKRSSLLQKQIWSPTVRDPRFLRFFEQLASDPGAALRISTINCDSREIGIDLSFDCNGHTFGHVLATNSEAQIDGLGSLLVNRAFIAAAARGTHRFEMMLPADAYKLQHADGETSVSSFCVAFTPKGRFYQNLYLRAMQPIVKSVARKFLAPLVARTLRALER